MSGPEAAQRNGAQREGRLADWGPECAARPCGEWPPSRGDGQPRERGGRKQLPLTATCRVDGRQEAKYRRGTGSLWWGQRWGEGVSGRDLDLVAVWLWVGG